MSDTSYDSPSCDELRIELHALAEAMITAGLVTPDSRFVAGYNTALLAHGKAILRALEESDA